MKAKLGVHAVVRHDHNITEIDQAITVVAVVPTEAEAVAEVERLAEVNAGKPCSYFWTPTRWYPEGRGVE